MDHTTFTVFQGRTEYADALATFLNFPWQKPLEREIAIQLDSTQYVEPKAGHHMLQQTYGLYNSTMRNEASNLFLQSFASLQQWPQHLLEPVQSTTPNIMSDNTPTPETPKPEVPATETPKPEAPKPKAPEQSVEERLAGIEEEHPLPDINDYSSEVEEELISRLHALELREAQIEQGEANLKDKQERVEPEVQPATSNPAVEGTDTPAVEGTDTPEVEGTDTPEVEGTDTPEVEGTDTPEVEGTDAPEVEGTDAPEVEGTDAPEVDTLATGVEVELPEVTDEPKVKIDVEDPDAAIDAYLAENRRAVLSLDTFTTADNPAIGKLQIALQHNLELDTLKQDFANSEPTASLAVRVASIPTSDPDNPDINPRDQFTEQLIRGEVPVTDAERLALVELTDGRENMRPKEFYDNLKSVPHDKDTQAIMLGLLHDKPQGFKELSQSQPGSEIWNKTCIGNNTVGAAEVTDQLASGKGDKETLRQLTTRPDVLSYVNGLDQAQNEGAKLSPRCTNQLQGFNTLLTNLGVSDPQKWATSKSKAAQGQKDAKDQSKLQAEFAKFMEASNRRLEAIAKDTAQIKAERGGGVPLQGSVSTSAPKSKSNPITSFLNKPVLSGPKGAKMEVQSGQPVLEASTKQITFSPAESQHSDLLMSKAPAPQATGMALSSMAESRQSVEAALNARSLSIRPNAPARDALTQEEDIGR